MLELRKQLIRKLKEYAPDVEVNDEIKSRVHFHEADDDTPFPYVVFDLPNTFMNEEQEVFVLDVDIWDMQDDSTTIEELSEIIWKKLNKYYFINNKIQFTIHRSLRLPPLDETERNIKRRKLTFELRYFDRNLYE